MTDDQLDPRKRSNDELEALIQNYLKAGLKDEAQVFIVERLKRGRAPDSLKKLDKWNEAEVQRVLWPFEDLSRLVADNLRAYYATGGGGVFVSKDSPDWRSVDSYTGIKKKWINATFGCQIREIGDEPEFILTVYSGRPRGKTSYSFAKLDHALARWQELVNLALDPNATPYVSTELAVHLSERIRPFLDGATYGWKLNEAKLSSLGINLLSTMGQTLAQRTTSLKDATSNWWQTAPVPEKERFSRWLIRDWGGITRVSDDKISFFVQTVDCQNPSVGFDGVSSLSKVLSFVHPTRFAIYDSRVSVALNAIQITSALDPQYCIAFPYPPGRNTALFGTATSPGFVSRHSMRTLHARGFLEIPRDAAYVYYMELLRNVSDVLECSISQIEMALFAQSLQFAKEVR